MERSVDFARIVVEIQAANGWDDVDLAKVVGVNRTTITRLRERIATNPGYALGDTLVKLHDRRPSKPGRKAK